MRKTTIVFCFLTASLPLLAQKENYSSWVEVFQNSDDNEGNDENDDNVPWENENPGLHDTTESAEWSINETNH